VLDAGCRVQGGRQKIKVKGKKFMPLIPLLGGAGSGFKIKTIKI
jgi:hypothetical protein